MATLDPRLRNAGLSLTTLDLIQLWADHCPKNLPAPLTCPGCGHDYTTSGPLCPTAAVLRPILRRRRREVPAQALKVLTHNQYTDLTGKHLSTQTVVLNPRGHYPAGITPPEPAVEEQPRLFDITPKQRGGLR